MVKAYIISTGTELLLGSTIDTNSVYLSQRLHEIGIRVVGKSVVGDNEIMMKKAFETGLESADLLIATGGLGPTFDDLTKKVACDLLGLSLEIREDELENLKNFFKQRQREMPSINIKQAMFPKNARVLGNDRGTAPGMYCKEADKLVILLPGPPHEMKNMFDTKVIPLLQEDYGFSMDKTMMKTIKVFGPGESKVEEMLGPLLEEHPGISMALLAKEGEIHVKLTVEGQDEEHSRIILNDYSNEISARLAKSVFGYDQDTLVTIVRDLLLEQRKTLAVAESCTGGLLSKMLTDLPGSSKFFWGGAVSYDNEAKKRLLGVSEETLAQYGAVSPETAREMAREIRKSSHTDYALAITGLAGPDGGSETKPVGLVYIALDGPDECIVRRLHFVGSRQSVRVLAAKSSLDLLRRKLQKQKGAQ